MNKITKRIPAAGMIIWCACSATGCSSVMSHTGPEQGYYSGTRANTEILEDHNTRWPIKTLAVVDYPFSAVMDTLLVPWDYFRKDTKSGGDSLHARVAESEALEKTDTMVPSPPVITAKNPSP